MKQNLLKILLLASSVTISLCACENKTSDSESNSPSNSVLDSESVTSSDTSNSSSDEQVDDNSIVELSRYIYLEGENALPYLTRYDVWSNALGGYKSQLKGATVIMPEECPNGDAYITVVSGTKKTQVKIGYFKDAEAAVKSIEPTLEMPSDPTTLFNETKYIKNGKLQFTCSLSENGELLTQKSKTNAMYIGTHPMGMEYNSHCIELWDSNTLTETGYYDSTKKTMDHYVVENTVDGTSIDYYNSSYQPNSSVSPENILNYEIILDGDGRIVYLGAVNYTSASWPRAGDEEGYWSCYKDYKENPVFTFAEAYNEESNPSGYDQKINPDAYQKVIPENGTWLIGYNNAPSLGKAEIDAIWNAITGLSGTIYSAESSIRLTMDDETVENNLMNSRIKVSGRSILVFTPSDTYEKYAYYYSLALASGDEGKLALRNEIYNSIVRQQLPQVKNEEVLFKYYEGITSEKLDEWASMFTSAD